MLKKLNPISTICITVVLGFCFFAVKPLSKEIHFATKWTVDCNKPSPDSDKIEPSQYIPFKLGQNAGFFTEDGQIAQAFTFPYKIAISPDDYCIYGTSDKSLKLVSKEGKQKKELKMQGFPFFQKGRKFLMLPGGTSFVFLNENFEPKWKFENYVPVTALDSTNDKVAAGYADGSILIFDADGKIERQYEPGGSKYPVILGLAVSEDGLTTASVSGQKQQRFTLAKRENGITKIFFHEYLESDTTKQVLVNFSSDGDYCYFAHKDCLGVLNCKTLKSKHIPVKGNILSIEETSDKRNIFVLSKNDGIYSVSVIQKHSVYSGSFSFKAENAYITVKDNSLFVGRDSSLSRVDIEFK